MSILNLERPLEPGAEGVYRVYLKLPNEDEVTLYIGRSSNLTQRHSEYSRGQKLYRTKDASKLDTIIIVHSLLDFLKNKGCQCYFEHMSWDNSNGEEDTWVKRLTPTMQRLDGSAAHVAKMYYLEESQADYWKADGRREEARRRLFELFEREQWPLIQTLCPSYFMQRNSQSVG